MNSLAAVAILGTFAVVAMLVLAAKKAGRDSAENKALEDEIADIDKARAARNRYANNGSYRKRVRDFFRR